MRLDRYISKNRILDLEAADLEGALVELLDSIGKYQKGLPKKSLLKELIQRENTIATYLGHGVVLPHLRIKTKAKYIFAIGRSRQGIQYEGFSEEKKVHLVFVLLANENEKNYLRVLASIARVFKDAGFVDRLVTAPDVQSLRTNLMEGFSGIQSQPNANQNKINRLFFRHAGRMAKSSQCSSIVLFADCLVGTIEHLPDFDGIKTVVVSANPLELAPEYRKSVPALHIQSFSNHRMAQLKSAVLIGLSRGLFSFSDRICCIGGLPGGNQFDSMVIIDVEKEFRSVLTDKGNILPNDVKPEVLERVLAIATELTVEGREGRKVGALFVVGDEGEVEKRIKPLVLNPFFGYKEEDRNILNPFMDETVKEFSTLDGAFVIRGDGVIMSAGSLINSVEGELNLPSGLGARHAAAAAISASTECISVVISSSTGQVTLFRRGIMLPLIEKGIGGSF